jgi:hypothetical protein
LQSVISFSRPASNQMTSPGGVLAHVGPEGSGNPQGSFEMVAHRNALLLNNRTTVLSQHALSSRIINRMQGFAIIAFLVVAEANSVL